jgi:hypothetical protein
MTRYLLLILAVLSVLPAPAYAASKRELDDLKRSIDTHRGAVTDLERQDAQRAVTDEITRLRTWLDEAINLLKQEETDRVREMLDRLNAQEELIRQRIAAGSLMAQAQKREADLAVLRTKIGETKEAIEKATVTKKALEMNAQ